MGNSKMKTATVVVATVTTLTLLVAALLSLFVEHPHAINDHSTTTGEHQQQQQDQQQQGSGTGIRGVIVATVPPALPVADDDDDDDDAFYDPHSHEGNSTVSATFSIRITPEQYHIVSWSLLWLGFVGTILWGVYQIRRERQWCKYVRSSRAQRTKEAEFALASKGPPYYSSRSSSNGGSGGGFSRSGRIIRASSRGGTGRMALMHASASSASINSTTNHGTVFGDNDDHAVSSGDLSRATFRRLLLYALSARMVAIPIQIYADPLWIQLIMDTFPVMVFATAWTWLVSFFVQLVGVALGITHPGRFEIPFQARVDHTITSTSTLNTNTGGVSSEDVLTGSSLTASRRNTTGNNSMNEGRTEDDSPSYHSHKKPGIASIDTVIQITAYTIYGVLIILFAIFRKIAAAILIYALLCCIYAVLFGTGLYFCPRLLGLLVPGLIPTTTTTTTTTSSSGSPQNPQPNGGAKGTAAEKRNFGVVVRLSVCTLICLFVFAARTVCFARKVVQSTSPLANAAISGGGGPFWWFQYGVLELLPGLVFLLLLPPKTIPTSPPSPPTAVSPSLSVSLSSPNLSRTGSGSGSGGGGTTNDALSSTSTGRRTPPLYQTATMAGGGSGGPTSYLLRSDSTGSSEPHHPVTAGRFVQPILAVSSTPSPVQHAGSRGIIGGSGSGVIPSETSPLLAMTTGNIEQHNRATAPMAILPS